MKTAKKFTGPGMRTLLAARVRLHDDTLGTIASVERDGSAGTLLSRGVSRRITLADIKEVGDDVQFRASSIARKHSLTFVSMQSLLRKDN